MAGVLTAIGSVIGSVGSVFASREQRLAQEEITEQGYIRYLGERELQAEAQESWILLAIIALIVVMVLLIAFRK